MIEKVVDFTLRKSNVQTPKEIGEVGVRSSTDIRAKSANLIGGRKKETMHNTA